MTRILLFIFVVTLLTPASAHYWNTLLRPMNDKQIAVLNQNVTITFRYREQRMYTATNRMEVRPIDGSVSRIPMRAPGFVGKFSHIERWTKNRDNVDFLEKQFLTVKSMGTMFMLDYEIQFFPESRFYVELKGTKILRRFQRVGIQERFYWDDFVKKQQFYIFTNMFPNHADEGVPLINDWPAKMILNIGFPQRYGYHVITGMTAMDSAPDFYYAERMTQSDLCFVLVNSKVQHDFGHLHVIAKPDYRNEFPAELLAFEQVAAYLFPRFGVFLNQTYVPVRRQLKLVILPALTVPIVLGREMCLFDQLWLTFQHSDYPFILNKCILHQYFHIALRPYEPALRFLYDGLFGFFAIDEVEFTPEAERRLYGLVHAVIDDENDPTRAVLLYDPKMLEYQANELRTSKAIAFVHMIKRTFKEENHFFVIVRSLINVDKLRPYTLSDFVQPFAKSHQQMGLTSDQNVLDFMTSWLNSTGLPTVQVNVYEGSLQLKTAMMGTAKAGTSLRFPLTITLATSETKNTTSVKWTRNTEVLNLPYKEADYLYHVVNVERTTLARVNYGEENWNRLLQYGHNFTPLMRAVLINDAFYFYGHHQVGYRTLFRLFRWLVGERSPVFWATVEPVIAEMDRRLRFSMLHNRVRFLVRTAIEPFFEELPRSHNASVAIKWACWAGLPQCRTRAHAQLFRFMERGGSNVLQQQVDATLCGGMRNVSWPEFEHFLEIVKRVDWKRDVLLMAMCCQERSNALDRFLRAIFTREELDISTDMKRRLLVNTFIASQAGSEAVWDFFAKKHQYLFQLFGRRDFHRLLTLVSRFMNHRTHYRLMKLILTQYDLRPGAIYENIVENQRFSQANENDLYRDLTDIILDKVG